MVDKETLRRLLTPWLGTAFLSGFDRGLGRLADALNACLQGAWDFEEASGLVGDRLLVAVRDATRARMVVLLDSGSAVRVRVDDFDRMADELLYEVFRRLPRSRESFERVNAYSFRHDSLSALRALYVDFAGYLSEDERRVLRRMIVGNHPAYRYRAWLDA